MINSSLRSFYDSLEDEDIDFIPSVAPNLAYLAPEPSLALHQVGYSFDNNSSDISDDIDHTIDAFIQQPKPFWPFDDHSHTKTTSNNHPLSPSYSPCSLLSPNIHSSSSQPVLLNETTPSIPCSSVSTVAPISNESSAPCTLPSSSPANNPSLVFIPKVPSGPLCPISVQYSPTSTADSKQDKTNPQTSMTPNNPNFAPINATSSIHIPNHGPMSPLSLSTNEFYLKSTENNENNVVHGTNYIQEIVTSRNSMGSVETELLSLF